MFQTKHASNAILKTALCILLTISPSAFAVGDIGITELLKTGYEVKAAYQSPGQVNTVHYLILQKGSSVFQCATYSSTMALFNSYSNTYSCAQVENLIPNTRQ